MNADEKLASLTLRLDRWESNLRANRELYVRDNRPPEVLRNVDGQLSIIEAVRECVAGE